MNLAQTLPSGLFSISGVSVDPQANEIEHAGHKVRVEPKVMLVLCCLAQAGGQVLSRDTLLDRVWGETNAVSDEVLTRAISQARKAIAQLDPDVTYIETVSKSGYRLVQIVDWSSHPVHIAGHPPHHGLTQSKEAYQLFLQARSLNARINGRTELPVARELLMQAIALDPDFAEAHAELANCCTLIGTYIRNGATLETFEQSENHARRALDLKPGLASAMIIYAIALFTRGKMLDAIRLNEKAIALEPMNAEVVMRLGYFYAGIGHTRKAIPYLERAVELDPAQGRNVQVLALAKLANGELDEADILAKRAIDLHHFFAHDTYAQVAFAKGDHELCYQRLKAAWTSLKWMFDELYNEESWNLTAKLGSSPDRADRLKLSSMLMDMLGNLDKIPELPLFQGMVRCGDAENLFHLSKVHMPIGRHGSFLSLWFDTEPCRDIRTHPGFSDFAKRSGFEEAWAELGLPD